MSERNRCLELGCSALCCFDVQFRLDGSEMHPWEFFENARECGIMDIPNEHGVYYVRFRRLISVGRYYVTIVGACPNLDESFGCRIYHKVRPKACVNLRPGSKGCEKCRVG